MIDEAALSTHHWWLEQRELFESTYVDEQVLTLFPLTGDVRARHVESGLVTVFHAVVIPLNEWQRRREIQERERGAERARKQKDGAELGAAPEIVPERGADGPEG